MNLFRKRIARWPIVVVAAAAWLAISNHCAIAAVEAPAKMPMAHCHGAAAPPNAPAKENHNGDVECCKVLRATLLTLSSNAVKLAALSFVPHEFAVVPAPVAHPARRTRLIEWDTGPPGPSFVESVLQRSLLAHAPPVSLS